MGVSRCLRLRMPSTHTSVCIVSACCALYVILVISMILWGVETERGYKVEKNCLTNNPDVSAEELTTGAIKCRNALCNRKVSRKLKSTFAAGIWRSQFTNPGYHKHYDVNCSGIIHNNRTAISQAYEMIRDSQNRNALLLPCDETVQNWTESCDHYTRKRRYPLRAMSVEEEDYPLAYIIVAHKEAAQLERLLRVIYQPQNVYCIHIDMKSSPIFHKAIRNLANCFDNVFVASKLENVQYMGFTRVQADINCMVDLMAYKWNYVINLCGQDFPLKTNLEIVKQMKAYRGKNDIPGVYPEQTEWFVGRTKLQHKVINGQVVRTKIQKPSPPHNAKIYFGNAYYAASRGYVEYVLSNNIAKDLLTYLADSLSPDEHYWISVNRYPGVPGGYPKSTWASNVRFIRWTNSDYYAPCVGKYVRSVCIIGAGYLPYLSKQPHIFVNKVYYDYDPITLQCLEEFLDYRTVFPDTISEYVPEFPFTNMFS